MKRRSRPPTSPSIRRAPGWADAGVPCALVGTPACGSAHRRASCWTISWRRLSRARINQWRCVPAACQSNRNAAEKYARSKQGHGVILAAQLRCQAQFAAVHGAELASSISWLWCPSGKWRGSAAGREAMLVAAAAQFDSILRVSGADQTTPIR